MGRQTATLPRDNASLEFQALLSSCRAFLGTEKLSKLEALLNQGLEFDRLIHLSSKHGMAPLLYRSLSLIDQQAVPKEAMARLRVMHMQNAARNLRMTGELLRLLGICEAKGIQAIPIKGPILAKQVYGDITLRRFSDLDILVLKQDVLKVKDILMSEGYEQDFHLNAEQEKLLLKFDCEYTFTNKARGVSVEIHWQFALPSQGLDSNFAGIWERAEITTLENRAVLTLSPEDQLMALCVHGAKHCWLDNTIKMICDLAGLVITNKDLDWDKVHVYARENRAERILFIGLNLAERFIGPGWEIQEDISQRASADRTATALAAKIWDGLLADCQNPSRLQEEISFWMKAKESRLDSIGCIMRLAMQPRPRDWISMPLPSWMYPVYYLMRPVRLIREYKAKESTGSNASICRCY
jgi:hypothetical protein